MKIFNFFILMIAASLSFAQNAPINFEPGGQGADWNWAVFENDSNPPLEIIDNPDPSGINTSSTVAKYTALATGNPWAGCESTHGATELGPFILNETNSIIKIMVWKSVISDVGIKLAAPTGWAQVEIKVPNTKVNEWEELTFNFSSYLNPPASEGQLDQVIVFPDFDLGGRGQDNIIYFDNITFNPAGGQATEPTTAAPTPTRDPSTVISLFSDAYDDVPVDTWRTDWSAAALEDIQVAGNPTKKYSSLDFVGIETVANQIDVTEMTHFHMDVWSPDFTLFAVKLVDFGPDGAFGGGDDTEHQIDVPMPTQAQWVSLDFSMDDFVGMTGRQNIAQMILVGQPTGTTTVYVDNVYFYNGEGGGGNEPSVAAPTPTRDPSNVISLFSDAYDDVPVDTWRTDWSAAQLEDISIQGNATKKYSNLDFVGIETIASQLNISEMTHVHIDIWSPDYSFFGLKIVDFGADGQFGGGDDVEHQVDFDMPAQGEWVSLDIPLGEFVGLTTQSNIAQYILVGRPAGSATVYVDNFYFYNDISISTTQTDASLSPIKVFPNPVQAGAQVNLDIEVNQVEILDLQGRNVRSANNSFFSTQGLNAGTYFLRIHPKTGGIQTQKLIIQ